MIDLDFFTPETATAYFCSHVNIHTEKDVETLAHERKFRTFLEYLRNTTDDDLITEVLAWVEWIGKDFKPFGAISNTLIAIADNRGVSTESIATLLTMNTRDLGLEYYLASCENLSSDQAWVILKSGNSECAWFLAHNNYCPQDIREALAENKGTPEKAQFELLKPKPDEKVRSLMASKIVRAFDVDYAIKLVAIASYGEGDPGWEDLDPTADYNMDLQAVLNDDCPQELVEIFLNFRDTIGEIARHKFDAGSYEFQDEAYCDSCEHDEEESD